MRYRKMASWVCLTRLALVHSENGLSDGHDGHSDARKELSDAHDAPGLQPVHGALDRLVLSAGASAAVVRFTEWLHVRGVLEGGASQISEAQAGEICVAACVVTLPSLPVSGRLRQCRSGTDKRQRTCVEPA